MDSKRNLPQHVTRDPGANPEGKGASGFLLDWYQSEPRAVAIKTQRQVLAEFFTSMLVLSAKFKYKPVVGVPNYLYWIDGVWSLSLIAPDEWSAERRSGYAGRFVMQPDMTWTVTPSDLLARDNPVSDAVRRFYDAFAEAFDSDRTLEEILPFFVSRMHYYPRLFASALSRSIRASITMGGQTSIRCRDWQKILPRVENVLLMHDRAAGQEA